MSAPDTIRESLNEGFAVARVPPRQRSKDRGLAALTSLEAELAALRVELQAAQEALRALPYAERMDDPVREIRFRIHRGEPTTDTDAIVLLKRIADLEHSCRVARAVLVEGAPSEADSGDAQGASGGEGS